MRVIPILLMTACLTSVALAEQRVAVEFNVPESLAEYTGVQPVTFGVPLPQGMLAVDAPVTLVDASGAAVPGQFQVTATWTEEGQYARWLLVDALAHLTHGKAAPLTLVLNAKDAPPPAASSLSAQTRDDRVTINTGTQTFHFSKAANSIGRAVLKDGEGKAYTATATAAPVLELEGPVRAVVRVDETFRAADGSSIAQGITRYRFYAGQPYARIYHTMIWLTDDKTKIGELTYDMKPADAFTRSIAGVDGRTIIATASGSLDLRQVSHDRTEGNHQGTHLDGWIQAHHGPMDTAFAALRWPWQQYPTGLHSDRSGRMQIRLIDPRGGEPMSLAPTDVAVDGVMHNVEAWNLRVFHVGPPGGDMTANGPEAMPLLSPRGVSRTWEMLLWLGDHDVAPELKNATLQEPVLAYADPAFAVQAELPSPAAPYDAEAFPEIELALQNAFDFYTHLDAGAGDFGVWNFGDIQWNWTHAGAPIYRYWNNLGKGWSATPWALWLRSGDRRYYEHGEQNSRHVMDVDTCHVPEWKRADTHDHKLRGGQYHYSALHWGYGPNIFTYYVDSEYLPYYWYMTGYERARDVMLMQVEATAQWEDRESWMAQFRGDPLKYAGRHLYVMVKNIGALYEATWDPRLKPLLDETLELTLAAQFPDGNFTHVKTNHYLDQSLNIAARIYGWEKVGDAITRWTRALGDPLDPSANGNAHSPMSLWSAANLYRHTGDERVVEIAARKMNAHAATVVREAGPWRGLNGGPAHEAGPNLRDWPILMSVLRQWPATKRPKAMLPIAGVHSRLPVPKAELQEGWSTLRHVALTLDEADTELQIRLAFLDPVKAYRLRVIAPDGSVVQEVEAQPTPRTVAFGGSAEKPIIIPRDGQRGAYMLLIDVAGHPKYSPSIHLLSSTGKLVHWIGQGEVTLTSPVYAGEIWLKPAAGAELRAGWPLNMYVPGHYVLLDERQQLLAESHITQTMTPRMPAKPTSFAPGLPWGEPLAWQVPAKFDSLVSLIYPADNSWHRYIDLSGHGGAIALTREQWFDLMTVTHPDLPE